MAGIIQPASAKPITPSRQVLGAQRPRQPGTQSVPGDQYIPSKASLGSGPTQNDPVFERQLEQIKNSPSSPQKKLEAYSALAATLKSKESRIRLLTQIYSEAANFMYDLGDRRLQLAKRFYNPAKPSERLDHSKYKKEGGQLNTEEGVFLDLFNGSVSALADEPAMAQSALHTLSSPTNNNNRTKYGLSYLAGRLYFRTEIAQANYSPPTLLSYSNDDLTKLAGSLGLSNDPEVARALLALDSLVKEEEALSALTYKLGQQIDRAPANSSEKKRLMAEKMKTDDRFDEVLNAREPIVTKLSSLIINRQAGSASSAKQAELLLKTTTIRQTNTAYLQKTRNNLASALLSVKGLHWSQFGSITPDGRLDGEGGVSCIGFVDYMQRALPGGQSIYKTGPGSRRQADFLGGKNNPCPFPILTDIPSSIDSTKMLTFMAATGNYFAVQTFRPQGDAAHSAVIYLDTTNPKRAPILMVAESTSLGVKAGHDGPTVTTFESWAIKERRQNLGQGVSYSLVILDPDGMPKAFESSSLRTNLARSRQKDAGQRLSLAKHTISDQL